MLTDFALAIGCRPKTEDLNVDVYFVAVELSENEHEVDEILSRLARLKRAMRAEGYKPFGGKKEEGWFADGEGEFVLLPVDGEDNKFTMCFAALDMPLTTPQFAADMDRILHHTFDKPEARVS